MTMPAYYQLDVSSEGFESFPEPRTIPAGWDVTNLFAAERATRSGEYNAAELERKDVAVDA
jgi:hypothetical protein